MEYFVLLVEKQDRAIAKVIGSAPNSSAARKLAESLDIKHHGRITGRTIFMDEKTLITWRVRGKVASVGSLIPE
jgi:hypothetical protein